MPRNTTSRARGGCVMPYCDIYRVRRTLFGKSVLQQYFNGKNLSTPRDMSGWVDVMFQHAPAALNQMRLMDKQAAEIFNISNQTNDK